MKYNNLLKKKMCSLVVFDGNSTIKTAEENGIPLKTFEKWITSFRKDVHCFDSNDNYSSNDFHLINPITPSSPYDNLSEKDLKITLMKRDIEIARLKKGYTVKGGGTEKKEFVTFSKKNMK